MESQYLSNRLRNIKAPISSAPTMAVQAPRLSHPNTQQFLAHAELGTSLLYIPRISTRLPFQQRYSVF